MAVSLNATEVENIVKAIGTAGKFDWMGAWKALHSADTEAKIKGVVLTVEEILSIVGIFVPIAAVIANDMQALSLLLSLYDVLKGIPTPPSDPNSINVFGHQMDNQGLFN